MTERISPPAERQAAIVRLLAQHGRLDVSEVAGMLGVAQETIRRDLRNLEPAGVLRRVHGGAIAVEAETRVPIPTLTSPDPSDSELAACLWARLPRSGTILLGNGPLTLAITHAIMADEPEQTGLTVVTNSLDAAVHLARLAKLSIYNIGGTVSHATRAQEGDWALDELSRLRVDVAVLSPAGISVEHGLSESTPAAAAVAQAAVACSGHRVAVCRSDTIGRNAFVRFAGLEMIHELLVVGSPETNCYREIVDHGVPVTIVGADHPKRGSGSGPGNADRDVHAVLRSKTAAH